MNAFLSLLTTELKFQWRHGFVIAAGILTLVWVLLLSLLPDSLSAFWFGIVAILDISSIGLLFGFGLGVLDNSQESLIAVRLTPVKSWVISFARVTSLSLLMVITLLLLGFLILETPDSFLLGIGILLLSVFFSVVGVTTARRFNTVNQFMIFFAISGVIWAVPALYFADILTSNFWLAFPSSGAVIFLQAALIRELTLPIYFAASFSQIFWISLVFYLGEYWAPKNFQFRFGGH
jgi:fluoroquinolone transport system permease protein